MPHFSEGIDSVPERHRARATPLGLRNAPPPPAAVERAPAAAAAAKGASGGTTIEFIPGQRIVVEARLNGAAPARLLLDTGADRTVIAPRVLASAGVSLTQGTRPGTIRGATGTADVQSVPLQSLEIGEARVANLVVVAHDIDQAEIDGLLGRDFLDQFKVSIDSARGVATLAPKE